ncbi:MAG: prohibitin family protein, partial [bacterium]
GLKYRERVIDPAVQEAVKAVTSLYTAEELITHREEVKAKIQEALVKRLAGDHILISAVNITDFDFSQRFNEAIESKQTAEQLALKAQRDLERIKIEAEQKITQAKGEAESQRLLAQSVTEQVITLKIIEKWDGKLPGVMGNAVPFWDILKSK